MRRVVRKIGQPDDPIDQPGAAGAVVTVADGNAVGHGQNSLLQAGDPATKHIWAVVSATACPQLQISSPVTRFVLPGSPSPWSTLWSPVATGCEAAPFMISMRRGIAERGYWTCAAFTLHPGQGGAAPKAPQTREPNATEASRLLPR